MRNKIKKAVILLIWLGLWQITAFFVNNPVYFASPAEVVTELFIKIRDFAFWLSVAGTLARILSGFFSAFILALITAFVAHKYGWFRDFLSPLVTFFKSVPVAAVVVILLIWWGPRYLVLCISLMVVFPNIYLNMQTGLENTDKGLIEMAEVFGLGRVDRLLWIYRSACLPYLQSAVSVSLGMCFKSGIAAEVIGLPEFSAGEQLYRDKIYLNTAGVFAWVFVILIMSSVTERLIMYFFKRLSYLPHACITEAGTLGGPDGLNTYDQDRLAGAGIPAGYTAYSQEIAKSYDERTIFDTDIRLKAGHIYCLKGPSGTGKTTLLKVISGILSPDRGTIQTGKISMVFQDDRLIEHANGLRNLKFAGCHGDLKDEVLRLLPISAISLPASELSGGERRRLCILRAMLHPSDIVIMDEPFAGLDEKTKGRAADFIHDHLQGRTLLFTAHEAESVFLGDAEEIKLVSQDS